MNLTYKHEWLEFLANDQAAKTWLDKSVVRAYQLLIAHIAAAADERELRNIPGYRFKELKGKEKGIYQIRLNNQYRVKFTITPGTPKNTIHITDVGQWKN